MAGIRDQKNIEELRKRLYDRGGLDGLPASRHKLTNVNEDVSRGWAGVSSFPNAAPSPEPVITENQIQATAPQVVEDLLEEVVLENKSRPYRKFVLLGSIGLFVLVALVSSVYLFFGANQISAKNVSINVGAPFSLAAGEVLPLQISISNQNSVPIESATLIINYPAGTKTNDDQLKDLYESRIPVDNISPGEAINIPVSVILFGEENDEKEIKVVVEYRVTGSNGTFFKEAEPIKIKINSSPLVIRVNSIEKVSSGQEFEIKITVQSNTASPQRNILVSASYPNTFSFIKSDPEPSYGQNGWLISEIKPESSTVITLRGRVNGLADEVSEIQLTAGTPKSDNQFIMGSVMTKVKTSYAIERPFIDVSVIVNQDSDGKVDLASNEEADVTVLVKNTLNDTVYDMRVEVSPKGNLIRDNQLQIQTGLYDSSSKTIRWEVSGMSSLAEVKPGETREFKFLVKPDVNQNTASFDISTNVFARRVGEARAAEEMVGTALAEVKYSSEITLQAQVGHSDGIFTDTGPIPPVADETTSYTITFEVKSGSNDATNMVMTTTLPQYVNWLEKYNGDGQVEYNPVAKQLKWKVGNLESKTAKQLQVQVSLLPSVTQVGRTLTIVGNQELTATDRFTGATLKAQNSALQNELSTEAGFQSGNGKVQPKP